MLVWSGYGWNYHSSYFDIVLRRGQIDSNELYVDRIRRFEDDFWFGEHSRSVASLLAEHLLLVSPLVVDSAAAYIRDVNDGPRSRSILLRGLPGALLSTLRPTLGHLGVV